jgi:hypothetical protein
MSREVEDFNRRLLRARDAMDRAYAERLDVRAVAMVAHVSEAPAPSITRAVTRRISILSCIGPRTRDPHTQRTPR